MRVMHFSEHMHVCLIDDNKFGQRQQSRVMLVEISTEKFIFYTFFLQMGGFAGAAVTGVCAVKFIIHTHRQGRMFE